MTMKTSTKNAFMLLSILLVAVMIIVGCNDADRVNRNLTKEAENFQIVRRVIIFNSRTDKAVLEVIGLISVEQTEEKVYITVKEGKTYRKHFFNLNEWNSYVVEDLSGANVPHDKWVIKYDLDSIIPFEIQAEID